MESVGRFLRKERELRQVGLEELSQITRIPVRTLRFLEQDRFDVLPGDVFVRGFLRSYATALGIATDEVIALYGQGRRALDVMPLPFAPVAAPESGRRFGLALALVVLLILFTLALSIVLRPRHRDVPVELSSATPALLIEADASPNRVS